ncbi:winged helix-turn-helix transcriptional regulator [Streptomyces sp. NPDC057062]|uniref:winged helix-turn-helix transcriptional regulator n=1 Tax=Streptomyces sp. NPDC057062 TaxID=3346011 RepID=UPI003644EB91
MGGDQDGPLADCPDSALVPPGHEPRCPVDITLAALGGRWTPLVVREFLRRGQTTYSELSAALPALSDRPTQLTSAGLIERHRTPGWPPRVRYILTSQGRALEQWRAACGSEAQRDRTPLAKRQTRRTRPEPRQLAGSCSLRLDGLLRSGAWILSCWNGSPRGARNWTNSKSSWPSSWRRYGPSGTNSPSPNASLNG